MFIIVNCGETKNIINSRQVTFITDTSPRRTIRFSDGNSIQVNESFQELAELLHDQED
ncbi:hypothetical protein EV196_1161 [Mariniflexile fucanivorans]|uniref:Uncharacterized protein n=1 Tax=Mariniflexile fucanivorans TaxID=264023 RepID=A0A4V2QCX5_9FLAO|nr:hypothetical protein EV196_1161 [Mariniflexile fucanivorans]